MIGAAAQPEIIGLLGATGSGKTQYLKRYLLTPRPRRLLVWDFSPEDEYAQLGHVLPLPDVIGELQAAKAGPFGLVFKPSFDDKRRAREFELFCRAAYLAGNLTMVVEELRYVTQPALSPPGWRLVVLTGRKRGLRVIGTSQRPAHIDKDFLGNATRLHVGLLNYRDDVQVMAQELGVDAAQVSGLPFLHWIELDRRTRQLSRGQLIF